MPPSRLPPAKETGLDAASPLRPIALELRHCRLVLAVVEAGSMTGAGERLHLTQSALSHQLREIETRLGVRLFLRVGRRLVLTDAGRKVLEVAPGVLAEVMRLEDDLRGHAAGRRGVLRLTTECYTCYDWLPPIFERFARRYPEVEVRIDLSATNAPLRALREGTVDLALVTAPVADRQVESMDLFEDELLLAVSRGHRLAGRSFVRPADLAAERLLLYGSPAESRFYQQFLARHGIEPRECMAMQLTEALISMVRAGMGVSPLARWALEAELARGGVVGLRLGERGMYRRWVAAIRRHTPRPDYLAEFAGLLAEFAAPGRRGPRHLRRRAG